MIRKSVYVILMFLALSVTLSGAAQAKIVSVSAGSNFVLALSDDGSVWAWGGNMHGETGTGTTGTSVVTPQKTLIDNVKAISTGGGFSIALKNDGTVWAWGENDEGQLGNGNTDSSATPVQVDGLSNVIAISAGSGTGYSLMDNGTVWAWGRNDYGQIGDNTTENKLMPVQVEGLTGIKALGENGYYAIKDDGTIYAWGSPESEELHLIPYQVTGVYKVKLITTGEGFAVYVKDDGTVWAWGTNRYGALGDGTITNDLPFDVKQYPVQTKITDVRDVSINGWHCIALKNDGTVWEWGYYIDGRLMNDGYGSPLPVETVSIDSVIDVSTSGLYCVALKSDGSVWGWGINGENELGDNNRVVSKPIMIFKGPGTAISSPTITANPTATSCPTITANPTATSVTVSSSDPSVSAMPTSEPRETVVPSPGFGFDNIGILCCILLIGSRSLLLIRK